MVSPYEVLRIPPDAEDWEIEQAYRQRVKESHPDHGGSLEEFKAVRSAYYTIKSGGADRDESIDHPKPDPEPRQPTAQVEYLNYDVLAERGWAITDSDLFEKASNANLDPIDWGELQVEAHESILQAAERRGFTWPYACRGGACANCAIAVINGDLDMPANHILPSELLEQDIRLSCIGTPISEELKVVYNIKHRPDLDDLRLPPHRFNRDHPKK